MMQVRINDISKNHHGKKFVIVITAVEKDTHDFFNCILQASTTPIIVKSKPTNSKNKMLGIVHSFVIYLRMIYY